jgi:hypothetical protein
LRGRPDSPQSTNGARYFCGSRESSRSTSASTSDGPAISSTPSGRAAAASFARRRAAIAFAFSAARRATPWSHAPSAG